MAASSNQKVHRDYEIAKLQARVKALEYENSMIMGMLQRVIVSNSQNASFQQQPSCSEMQQSNPIPSSKVTFDRNALKEINDASEFYDLDEDHDDEYAEDYQGYDDYEDYEDDEDYEEEQQQPRVYNEEEHDHAPVTTLDEDVLTKAFEKAIQTSHW